VCILRFELLIGFVFSPDSPDRSMMEAMSPMSSQPHDTHRANSASPTPSPADPAAMHRLTPDMERLAQAVLQSVLDRQGRDPWPLGETHSPEELGAQVGHTVTAAGLGAEGALRCWQEHLQPANVAVDHPAYLAFIPHAPNVAAMYFDMLFSGLAIYAGFWL
jgi:hypothetical protein